jgi:hypothetical protein
MTAELDGVVGRRDRWSFAAGCAATVVRQFTVLRSLVYTVSTVAAVAGVVVWSEGVRYQPLRWGMVALVAALAGVITLGRVSGPIGPVARDASARLLRGAGAVVVAVVAASVILRWSERVNQVDEARFGVPIIGSTLACYLLGFVAVTADRSMATGRTLRWGALCGVTAAVVWLAAVVSIGLLPTDPDLTLAMLLAAVTVAVAGTVAHRAQAWVAALVAGAVSTLLIVIELVAMASYAPARMIPDLAPAALTAADDLAQSRAEVQDPYVIVFGLGAAIALLLGITGMVARTRRAAPASHAALPEPEISLR